LSVREASEADDKYSAAISAPYPLNILNLLLGTYILSVKNPRHNRYILYFYYMPTFLITFALFIIYQIIILPFCYIKIVAHKSLLIIKNPQGVGSKTKSDRAAYALFFVVFGLLILALDMVVDTFWFLLHLFKTDLDMIAK
jgi:hypothetical protein